MTKLVSIARGTLASLVLGAIACAALATGLSWSTPVQAAQEVSKEFFEKFKPAQDALQKRDYATALRAAKESAGAAKNNTEKEYALKVQLSAAFGTKSWADASSAADGLIALPGPSAAEKNNYRRMLGQIAEQQRQYDRAIQYTQEAMKGGATQRDYELLFRVYAIRGDCNNALANLDKSLGGKPANETQLKARNSCLFKQGNVQARVATIEELVRRFPKKAYFTDLVSVFQEQKVDERTMLNVYRWGFEKDLIEREADYLAFADAALNASSSAEANRALQRGVKAGLVKTADANSRTARLVASTAKIAADDKAKLPQLDKEARAGRNGESDVAVGTAFFGNGEHAKAVEAIERAFQPDRANRIRRPDDANMVLGISLLKTGKKAEATKAFNAAKADPKMAKAASLWLGG